MAKEFESHEPGTPRHKFEEELIEHCELDLEDTEKVFYFSICFPFLGTHNFKGGPITVVRKREIPIFTCQHTRQRIHAIPFRDNRTLARFALERYVCLFI